MSLLKMKNALVVANIDFEYNPKRPGVIKVFPGIMLHVPPNGSYIAVSMYGIQEDHFENKEGAVDYFEIEKAINEVVRLKSMYDEVN